MTDRNVQYPYRFHVRPVPGTDDICEIIPAPGTVYEDGTFWNKQNVLQDAVAALYGKDAAATPNDIFAAIRPLIVDAKNAGAKIASGSYVGTGADLTLTFGFKPKSVFVVGKSFFYSSYYRYCPSFGIIVGEESFSCGVLSQSEPYHLTYGIAGTLTENGAIIYKDGNNIDGRVESNHVNKTGNNPPTNYYIAIG